MTDTLQDLLAGKLPPGVYRCGVRGSHGMSRATIERLAAENGWQVFVIDGKHIADKAEFLAQSARSLRFPDYFGNNWDAFEESLNDVGYDAGQRSLVLLDDAASFARASPQQFATALDIMATVAQNRSVTAAPLAFLLRGGPRSSARHGANALRTLIAS